MIFLFLILLTKKKEKKENKLNKYIQVLFIYNAANISSRVFIVTNGKIKTAIKMQIIRAIANVLYVPKKSDFDSSTAS